MEIFTFLLLHCIGHGLGGGGGGMGERRGGGGESEGTLTNLNSVF